MVQGDAAGGTDGGQGGAGRSGAGEPAQHQWRVDDLAARAGVSVDTVRFYQREGLLPPTTKRGRSIMYGPEHLARIEQIRGLQERRFSLAAIKSLLELDQPALIDGIFQDSDTFYTVDEFAERSGVDREFLAELCEVGLLRDPSERGREAYDANDLRGVRAVRALMDDGIPKDLVLQMVEIHVRKAQEQQQEVLDLFGELQHEDDEFAQQLLSVADRLWANVQQLAAYVQQRTLQQMTFERLRARQRG